MFQGKKTVSPGPGSAEPVPGKRFTLKVALWLLDSPRLGRKPRIKHLAGRLLKQPARQGVVVAQSRLGQMLCHECGSARDRRMGHELLRQAARSGDPQAQFEYGRLCADSPDLSPERARHWLELAAAQGSPEAGPLLRRLFPD
ncbi:sel1 repeat family protein [Pseudomonas entomophila]|jgi:TPR repeat protein|uniref:tetratricopeptide repeat protein n=1 Tax=Pseudomonas entomophila TaxID=312306 RepID=UPI0015E2CD8D|nr:tetratricopeptide repeat protein [Pseudomonas entomophila]MBA1195160.1 sel1 repeat family protein [Pseudomonas entomophila]